MAWMFRRGGSELLYDDRWIPRDDDICGDAFGDDGAGGDDAVVADGDAFEDDGVHADPDAVADDDGGGFERGAGGAVFVEGGEGHGVDAALGGVDGVEVAVGDADVPGDEAVGADLDAFVGHEEGAVEEGEIADGAGAVFAE